MRKFCPKCHQINEFEASKLPYVAKRTGGTKWICKKCSDKWFKDNNVKEVIRVETPDQVFSCKFEYKYYEK